ncbi:MAG TPA: transposase [Syntrophorhabdaceae bacterium]|jgi:REP element-mobilizing transposase RayT
MPRKSRLDAAGILHHIMVRGIEKRSLFKNNTDRRDFFERCEKLFTESNTRCYAWAFLSNHVHLLLRTGNIPLSKVMACLLSGYATGFNRRYKRSGHLFQNRYKSIICQEENYFKELVVYIHLNPFRAGLVTDITGLNLYRWSGHPVLIGKGNCPWQDADYTLASFGGAAAYLEFLEKRFDQGRREDLTGGGLVRSSGGWLEMKKAPMKGDERVLGDSSFVLRLLADAQERLERHYALKQSGVDIDDVEKRVTTLFNLSPGDLYGSGRPRRIAQARALICYWAVHMLGLSQKALADRFSVTEAAITYAVRRGQTIAEENGYRLMENDPV